MKNKLIKPGSYIFFKFIFTSLMLIGVITSKGLFAQTAPIHNVTKLFKVHCAQCHSEHRLGGIGPALLPENLKYLSKPEAINVVRNGRSATPMPAFKDKLGDKDIQSLVDFIYTPLAKIPDWNMANITASHVLYHKENSLPNKPILDVKDQLNLIVVVERGDHHISLLDGDTFNVVHRFKSRFSLYGEPKFSASGRFVYFSSRDGWISKYDIYNLKLVAEIRVGINTRNMAMSADGRYLMVANALPHTLVLLNTRDLSPIKHYQVKDLQGKSSRVSAVYTSPPGNSFFAALKDIPEVWEISYADEPPHGFGMWMHDYRVDSGENTKNKPFPLRRVQVSEYLEDFFFAEDYISFVGVTHAAKGQVIDMDVKKAIVPKIDLPGKPHFGSAVSLNYKGRKVLAVPNFRKGIISILDMESWKQVKEIKTLGPGFYMQTHKNSPYIWTDVFFGPDKDAMHVIDKATLEIVKTLRPAPGKKSAHVEFTRNGKNALVSIWDKQGEVIIYDSVTLKEVKRMPMNSPSAKYNVFNQTRYLKSKNYHKN
ncbi:MAG: nitrite reductase [Gammaproteobacteria bacterium]|nr:nitrite reductase [Gammaproteobacteria bacterium]MCW8988271.1 nitrite reductase [Gammaproteobacteria bacterium]